MAGFDQSERKMRQYHAITGEHIDEDTMSVEALAKGSNEKHRDRAKHLVLNVYCLDSCNKILVEIRKFLDQEERELRQRNQHIVRDRGGDVEGQSAIKFVGNWWARGTSGHKQQDCRFGTSEKSKAKAGAKSTVKCEHCGLKGHRQSECYKLKATQAARSPSSPTTPLTEVDARAKKRKRDIAALERELAELKLEEFVFLDTSTENIEFSAVEVESQCLCAGCPAAEIGSVTDMPELISVCVDSAAEITVWPPELALETPTEETEESGSGVKCFPGDRNGRTLVNHGRRGTQSRMASFDGVGSSRQMWKCSPRIRREMGRGEFGCESQRRGRRAAALRRSRCFPGRRAAAAASSRSRRRWCDPTDCAKNADRRREAQT